MSQKMLCALLALAAISVNCAAANASILSNNLSLNGQLDLVVDQSRSNIINGAGGNPLALDVGDVIFGYLNFDEVALDGGGNQNIVGGEITALFSIQITASLGGGVFEHGPTTAAGFTLSDLLTPGGLAAEGINGDPIDPAAMFVIATSSTSVDPENVATSMSFFTAAAWDIELTGGKVAATDFFQVKDNGLLTGDGATESAALSVIQVIPDLDYDFLPVGADVKTDADAAFETFADLAIRDGQVFQNTGADSAFWAFGDRATVAVNITPEPLSVCVWLGIAGVAGLGIRRGSWVR